jgi:hypothetical protein
LKLVLTSALVGALFLISGCGTQCESVCAEFNSCAIDSNPPERFVQVDCANFCGGVDQVNARAASSGTAGCGQKWTAHLACWQTNRAEICNTDFDGCDDTAAEWATCVNDYCGTLAEDEYDPACYGGEIVFSSPFQSGF